MIKIYNTLNEQNLNSKIILQVHDELLLEVLPKEKEQIIEILKEYGVKKCIYDNINCE